MGGAGFRFQVSGFRLGTRELWPKGYAPLEGPALGLVSRRVSVAPSVATVDSALIWPFHGVFSGFLPSALTSRRILSVGPDAPRRDPLASGKHGRVAIKAMVPRGAR